MRAFGESHNSFCQDFYGLFDLFCWKFLMLEQANKRVENLCKQYRNSAVLLRSHCDEWNKWGIEDMEKVQGKFNVPSSSLRTNFCSRFYCQVVHRLRFDIVSWSTGERAENFYDHINNCSIDARWLAGKLALFSYFFSSLFCVDRLPRNIKLTN